MRAYCILYVNGLSQRIKAGIAEHQETGMVRQRLGKHVPEATNTYSTIEELPDVVFSVQFRSYQILNMQ
jgi:hypothetical protein